MKIPFGLLPSSWGLRGTTREVAEAEYYLKDLELDDRLAEIKYRDPEDEQALKVAKLKNRKKYKRINNREFDEQQAHLTLHGTELNQRLLNIQLLYGDINKLQYEELMAESMFSGVELTCKLLHIRWVAGVITEYDYKVAIAKAMIEPGPDLDLELLDIDLDNKKISKTEHAKRSADIKGEPFICVLNSEYNPDEKIDGLFFEFDWNDKWIEELKLAGYQGFTDDQIVQRWFTDICRGVVSENDQMYMADEAVPFNSSRITKRQGEPGEPTSYS